MTGMENIANTNMQELVGSSTVQLYNSTNEFLLGLGFTVIGFLLLCIILAVILKPLFYLFFTIKLGYQGTCEIFRIIKKIISFIWYISKEIYNFSKKMYIKYQNKKELAQPKEYIEYENNDEEGT